MNRVNFAKIPASIRRSQASRFASSCATEVAPTNGATDQGWCATKAMASSRGHPVALARAA